MKLIYLLGLPIAFFSCSKTNDPPTVAVATQTFEEEPKPVVIKSRKAHAGFSAYNLGSADFSKELNRTLDQVAGLQMSGDTKLGGRKGSTRGGLNEAFAIGGGTAPMEPARGAAKTAESEVLGGESANTEEHSNFSPPQNASKRSVTYEAHLVQSTRTPEKLLNSIDSILGRMGGQIIQRGNASGYWKVPADSFNKALQIIEPLGKIIDKTLQSSDLTSQVQETALRLKFLKLKVSKLKELVAQSKNTSDKLRLLQELEQAHYELNSLENEQNSLQDLIAYSRIALDLVPPQNSENQNLTQIKAFDWIKLLNPHQRNYQGSDFDWPIPRGLILLNAQTLQQSTPKYTAHWQVTSASGVSLWAHRQKNNPKGDTLFWTKAIVAHFNEQCRNVSEEHLQKVIKIRCESYDIEPYVYWVSLSKKSTLENTLTLVEAYFPSLAQEAQLKQSLEQFWKEVLL